MSQRKLVLYVSDITSTVSGVSLGKFIVLAAVYYITELTARLLENDSRYQAQYLIPMNLPRLAPDTVDIIFDTYKTNLRCDLVMF
jgi:hypothetical protein